MEERNHFVVISPILFTHSLFSTFLAKVLSNYRYIIAERGIPDPYGIKAFVREMILAAEQNPNIKSIKIRVDQEGEVEIDLDYYRNENNNENIS